MVVDVYAWRIGDGTNQTTSTDDTTLKQHKDTEQTTYYTYVRHGLGNES